MQYPCCWIIGQISIFAMPYGMQISGYLPEPAGLCSLLLVAGAQIAQCLIVRSILLLPDSRTVILAALAGDIELDTLSDLLDFHGISPFFNIYIKEYRTLRMAIY